LRQAERLLRERDPEAAINLLEKALARFPRDQELQEYLDDAKENQRNAGIVASFLRNVRYLELDAQDSAKADQSLKQAQELDSEDPRVQKVQAWLEGRQKGKQLLDDARQAMETDLAQALDLARQAIELAPDLEDAKTLTGEISAQIQANRQPDVTLPSGAPGMDQSAPVVEVPPPTQATGKPLESTPAEDESAAQSQAPVSPDATAVPVCPYCDRLLRSVARFCPGCGRQVVCQACESRLRPQARFCHRCGLAVAPQQNGQV
jgi:tetratricopeptide (TPR) repeat protein